MDTSGKNKGEGHPAVPVKKSMTPIAQKTAYVESKESILKTSGKGSRSFMKTPEGRALMKRGNKSPQRGIGSKYDWEAARVLYMTETPAINLKQVSMRTGIPYVQVRQKAGKERWSVLRAQEQAAVMKSKRQDHLRRLAGVSMTFDDDSIDTAKLGMNIVTSRLIEISQIYAAANQYVGGADAVIRKLQSGMPLERGDLYSVINYKELRELAQAAQIFQEIGRKALGSEQTDEHLFDSQEDVEKVVSIGGELSKDSPERLAAFLEALERTGVMNLDIGPEDANEEDTDQVQVIDGQLIPPPPPDRKQIEATVVAEEAKAVEPKKIVAPPVQVAPVQKLNGNTQVLKGK